LTMNVLVQLKLAQQQKMLQKCVDSISKKHRWTIHYVCNTVALLNGTCQSILSDKINMRQTAKEFVPRLLTDDQKQHQLAVNTQHCSGCAPVFCLQRDSRRTTPLAHLI
jgi:CYTH domain-containing protein